MGQIVFAVFPRSFCLGLFDRLLEGAQEDGLVGSLHCAIAFHDALRRVGMRPQRNSVGPEEGVPHRMIVVVVGVQGALDRHLADHPQSIHLEGSPGHFDPKLLTIFQRCLPKFEQIYRESGD